MSGKEEETTTEQFQKRLDMAISVNKRLAALQERGVPANSEDALDIIADHHQWVQEYLAKDQKTYLLLADKYRSDHRFEGLYNEYYPGLSHYMGDAIEAYAKARLAAEEDPELLTND
jgi:hypothetical protein